MPTPVLDAAEARGWRIDQVLNTHWHPDHTGGNAAIKAATGVHASPAPPPRPSKIAAIDRIVGEGDRVSVGGLAARCGRSRRIPRAISPIISRGGRDLRRRHDVRHGLRAVVRGNAEQMFANHAAARRTCPTTCGSIAGTNIRSPTRASPPHVEPDNRGDRRAAGARSRRCARDGEVTCRRRSARSARPIPSCAPATSRISPSCARTKTASVKSRGCVTVGVSMRCAKEICHARFLILSPLPRGLAACAPRLSRPNSAAPRPQARIRCRCSPGKSPGRPQTACRRAAPTTCRHRRRHHPVPRRPQRLSSTIPLGGCNRAAAASHAAGDRAASATAIVPRRHRQGGRSDQPGMTRRQLRARRLRALSPRPRS